MDFTAQQLRDMRSNIFATYDSIERVIESASDTISVMIAVNTTLELLAQQVEAAEAEAADARSAFDLKAEEAERNGGGE